MGAMLYCVNLIKQYNICFYNIKAFEDKIFSTHCIYLVDKIYLVNQLMYFTDKMRYQLCTCLRRELNVMCNY